MSPTFQQAVSEGLTIVDFWAPWCAPCRMMGPVLDDLAQRDERLAVAKVNVDENPTLAAQFRVQAIPMLVLMKNGQEVERFVGVQSAGSFFIDKDRPAALNKSLRSPRMWRNWQTRKVQVLVGATPWRFDSSHPQFFDY